MRTALLLATAVGLAAAGALTAGALTAEEPLPLDKLPKPVLEAVKKRFPTAEWKDGSKEPDENGQAMYEVSAKLEGRNLDVTVTADGAVTLIEREVPADKLPKAVAAGFEAEHPKATFKIVETVTKVADGKETLDYYEALVETADKKLFEVEILPDGKFKGETEKTPGDKD